MTANGLSADDNRLLGSLITKLDALIKEVTNLHAEIDIIKAKLNTSRGIAIGMLYACALSGTAIGALGMKVMEHML